MTNLEKAIVKEKKPSQDDLFLITVALLNDSSVDVVVTDWEASSVHVGDKVWISDVSGSPEIHLSERTIVHE